MQESISGTLAYTTIWLSDIHLGYRHCKAEFLLQLLRHTRCKTLYLVGDVIDIWSLSNQWHWPSEHSRVLRTLMDKAENGTRVIYVPGNHDELLRDFTGNLFGRIAIRHQAEHITADGRRLLVTHGDEFEHLIGCGRFARILGSASYSLLLRLNRACNLLRRWQGKPYWSLATYVKTRVRNARAAIEAFEEAALTHARHRGFDGVVCGHIHKPEIREFDGTLYCNDGDWVDNCTALVENLDGSLELLHWSALEQSLKTLVAANEHTETVPRPAAAEIC